MKPLLLLDVDGVLAPITAFGHCEKQPDVYARFNVLGISLFKRHDIKELLDRLSDGYDLVWATMWQTHANLYLCEHFGLPELPVISFPPPPWPVANQEEQEQMNEFFEGQVTGSVKLLHIAQFVGDKPFAWIDDHIGPDDRAFEEQRNQRGCPTLFVKTVPYMGLTEFEVEKLLSFAVLAV